jgi:hypothetical protein
MKKSLFMETTKISVGQTVSEIQRILGESGCTAVMTEYESKEIKYVCFQVVFLDKTVPFRLPCRWNAIYQIFLNRKKNMTHDEKIQESMKEQAKRVAWRQILRWVEAQMALVDTDMVKIQEVFLPYAQCGPKGETLYQQIENKGFMQLEYKG